MLQKSCCRLLTVLRLTIGFFFFCLCLLFSPHPSFLSTTTAPTPWTPTSFLLPLFFFSSSVHSSLAALLPNSARLFTPALGCAPAPAPAMTVSFTRVSPVSSLSLRQSPAPTARTRAQPQHRPTEGRHDHLCVGRRRA